MTALSTAQLNLPAASVSVALRQTAQSLGLTIQEADETLTLTLGLGTLTLRPDGAGAQITLEAASDAKLQALRDTVAERLANAAPGQGIRWSDGASEGGRPANISVLQVDQVARLSPSFYRVRLTGDLARFDDPTNGLHFKLLFGPDGALAPELDANGLTQWPGGVAAWHRPTYTIRAMDVAAKWMDVDVFIHDGGRVTNWCENVVPGAPIAISGPGGGGLTQAGWIGLIGDETALPVIARMLEGAGADTKGEAVIFVPDLDDRQDIATPAGVSLRWVLRGGEETPLSALEALQIPQTDRFVFLAGERSEQRAARTWMSEQGLNRTESRAAAYWTAAT